MSNQLNFSQQMDEVLKTLGDTRPRLLLHACCGPCSSAVLERLCRYFDITVLYYNPNTWPAEEYHRRGEELQKFVAAALEMPTHAFIGGSTGQLKEIIQCIKKKNPDVRIVINAISLETVKEAMEAMEEGLLADPEIIQLNVAKSKKLGRYHMMTGLNPIYIISDGGDIE